MQIPQISMCFHAYSWSVWCPAGWRWGFTWVVGGKIWTPKIGYKTEYSVNGWKKNNQYFLNSKANTEFQRSLSHLWIRVPGENWWTCRLKSFSCLSKPHTKTLSSKTLETNSWLTILSVLSLHSGSAGTKASAHTHPPTRLRPKCLSVEPYQNFF